MKKTLLLILTGLIPLSPFCQRTKSSGFISLNIGASIPDGDFADASYYNSSSGYAQVGPSFNFTFAMPIAHSWFGVATQIGYYNNAVDDGTFNRNLSMQGASSGIVTLGQYEEATIAAGLFVTVPVHKVAFDFKVMAGGAYCVFPEFKADNGGSISSDNTFSPVITGDFGFRYRFSKKMCAMVNISYLYTEPEFMPYSTAQGSISVIQPVSIVNTSLGIGFNIR